MNPKLYSGLAAFLALALSAHANAAPEDLNVELPQDLVGAIRDRLHDVLKDPEGARITITRGPRKVIYPEYGNTTVSGKAICAEINGKNSYGAYVGVRTWIFLFRKNGILVYEPGVSINPDPTMWGECSKPADPAETNSKDQKVLL